MNDRCSLFYNMFVSASNLAQFLVTEMEARWHTFSHQPGHAKKLEMTWSSKDDFNRESNIVRARLGCTQISKPPANNRHVRKAGKSVNCTDLVEQDFAYRKIMNLDKPFVAVQKVTRNTDPDVSTAAYICEWGRYVSIN